MASVTGMLVVRSGCEPEPLIRNAGSIPVTRPNLREIMKLKNLYLGLKDQMPLKRFFVNFFVTRNAWGLVHKRSHQRADGKEKVMYNTKVTANKVAKKMSEKKNTYFSNYKCLYCDGYHLGRNRDNK
tara:strand:+ start:871 stop:1251 length:381 start_codon:yes stop_codon:yes gene_type:complete